MQQHRIISLLSVLVMVIIPVIGLFLVAQPQLAAASIADQQRAEAAQQVAAAQSAVAQLKADSARLPELNAALNELRTAIPAGVDPEGYIDGLSALAKVAGVEITGLRVDDPLAYVPATPPGDASAPASESDDGAEADPAPAFPGIVTSPLINASNFVAIPVEIEISGKSSTILRFINGLQTNDRLFLVTEITTEQDSQPGELIGKVGGYIWAIPTGVVGEPRPVSTIVKQLDPIKPPEVETETPDPDATDAPDPGATDTPAP